VGWSLRIEKRTPGRGVQSSAGGLLRPVEVATGPVASTGHGVAKRPLEIGGSPTAGRKDHQTIPGIAQPRTDREEVGELVLC
jgi:hypothetical protein